MGHTTKIFLQPVRHPFALPSTETMTVNALSPLGTLAKE